MKKSIKKALKEIEATGASISHKSAMITTIFDATPRTPQEEFRARAQADNDARYRMQQAHSTGKKQYKGQKPKSCKGSHHHLHEAIDCTQCPLYRNAVLERHYETLKRIFHLSGR